MSQYIPRQGDIVWINLNPRIGHEQGGKRPALIIWNDATLNAINGMSLVCSITTTDNGFPLHVKLDSVSKNTTGFVQCEQLKVVDLISRNAEYKDRVSDEVLNRVLKIIQATIK